MLSLIPRSSNTDALHIVVMWRPGNENQQSTMLHVAPLKLLKSLWELLSIHLFSITFHIHDKATSMFKKHLQVSFINSLTLKNSNLPHWDCVDVVWSDLIDSEQTQRLSSDSDTNVTSLFFHFFFNQNCYSNYILKYHKSLIDTSDTLQSMNLKDFKIYKGGFWDTLYTNRDSNTEPWKTRLKKIN